MDLLKLYADPNFRGSNYESPGSPSSRTDNLGQGRQIHVLRPLTLMQFAGSSEGNNGSASFRIEVPDSRLRVNVALLGQATDGSNNILGGKGLTLWLRAVEDAIDGGGAVPITNLWGTGTTAAPIPGYIDNTGTAVADPDLGGWGKEFVTSGRAIEGTINYPSTVNTGAGLLVLQVRYTPEAIRFPRDEWDEIRKACARNLIGDVLQFAG